MTSSGSPPRRVLVKAANWLGDVVMSVPALRAIRRAWPRATLAVWIRRELAPLFAASMLFDEVIAYDHPVRAVDRIRRLLPIVRAVRERGFDLGIVLPNRAEPALWLRLAGVRDRIGYAGYRRDALLTRAIPRPTDLPRRHQAHDALELVRAAFTIEGDPADVALEVAPASRERIATRLASRRSGEAPFVALAPGAAYGPAKEWPAERYAALADRLARSGFDVVLVGSALDRPRADAVAAAMRAPAIVAAGETTVDELVALLSLATGFVGNDSGAMHVAGALGVPTVGIFGSTDPRRTAPLGPRTRVLAEPPSCSPCLARTCRFGRAACFDPIDVDAATSALAALGLRPAAA
jgi:heptosyltransferase II